MSLENLMSSLPKIHRSLSEPILNRWVFSINIKDIFTHSYHSEPIFTTMICWAATAPHPRLQSTPTSPASPSHPTCDEQACLHVSTRVYTCLCDLRVISLNSILVNSLTFQSIVINHLNTYICINLNCNIYELCKLHKVLSCICIPNTLKSSFLKVENIFGSKCAIHIILKGFIIGQAAWISVPFT